MKEFKEEKGNKGNKGKRENPPSLRQIGGLRRVKKD